MENYLIKFISATTAFTLLPLFYLANSIKHKNYEIFNYVLTAPLWLGFLNVVWFMIIGKVNLDKHYMWLVPISIICSLIILKVGNIYEEFREKEWKKYYLLMIIGHYMYWYIGVRNIDYLLSK